MDKTRRTGPLFLNRDFAPAGPPVSDAWRGSWEAKDRKEAAAGPPRPVWEGTDAQGPRPGSARRLLRRSLWGLAMGASVLAACALSRTLVRSPLFAVKHVELEASGRPGPDEIRSLSGIRPGMNLLCLDTAEISRRLESHPWIRSATVVKRLPDRVLIKVRERTPVLLIGIQGGLFYMDGEGKILDKIQPGEPLDFPMITGLGRDTGDAHRWGEGRDVPKVLALLRELQASPSLGSVSEIHVDRSEGLSFLLEGFPPPVDVGWDDFSAKRIRFEKVLPSLVSQSNAIERVDLRFFDQIVVRQGTGGKPPIPKVEGTKTRAGSDASFHTT